jgi:hypothetical protein
MFDPTEEEVKEMVEKDFELKSISTSEMKINVNKETTLLNLTGAIQPVPKWIVENKLKGSDESEVIYCLGSEKIYNTEEDLRKDIAEKNYKFLNS